MEDELDQMQQEQLDEQILKTGTVPIADAVHTMPSPAHADRKWCLETRFHLRILTKIEQPSQAEGRSSRRTTRKPNSGNYRPRWPCKAIIIGDHETHETVAV